jgi:chromosome segregation ATPase
LSVHCSYDAVFTLENVGQELGSLMLETEQEIGSAGKAFEDLARQTEVILELAAGVIGRVEDNSVNSILPKVQSLGAEVRSFIQERLRASTGILETVAEETSLLERLSQLARGQRSIARETQVLSVLTNIEVARLGELGNGFQYLARQLDGFSQSVAQGTKELAAHTDERKAAIDETRRTLAAEMPRMERELTQIEADLEEALESVDSGLTRLSQTPAQFRGCVEEIAGHIAGVVAAIQSYDITRQQVEHVEEGLRLIAAKMDGANGAGSEAGAEMARAELAQTDLSQDDLAQVGAGLAIQAYQLRSIRETMSSWVAQIRTCMDGILRIGCSDVMGIGPLVLEQERGLSSELARIGALEQRSQQESGGVRETAASLSNLMQLVGEHVERSRSVREQLQLLTFNSIIEASRLGAKADAILEISHSIKRISGAWGALTDRSAGAMGEILELVKRAESSSKVFSESGCGELAGAQAETRAALGSLRAAAEFVGTQATAIEAAIGGMQAEIAAAGASGDRLSASVARIDTALSGIQELQREIEQECPKGRGVVDHAEMEATYAASYTTEMEREVLRAALTGAPLPAAGHNLVGNDVELF